MATINLLIQSKKDPATIYIRLRDGKNLDIKAKTNYHINPAEWDKSKQRPLKKLLKDIEYANLETDLLALKSNLLMEYNKAKGKVVINSEWLRDYINPPEEEKKYSNRLVEYIDTYIDFKENDVAKATIVKCNVIKQLLIRFQAELGKQILVKDVNNDFKVNFEKYCIVITPRTIYSIDNIPYFLYHHRFYGCINKCIKTCRVFVDPTTLNFIFFY